MTEKAIERECETSWQLIAKGRGDTDLEGWANYYRQAGYETRIEKMRLYVRKLAVQS